MEWKPRKEGEGMGKKLPRSGLVQQRFKRTFFLDKCL
jgi:hypothetical protein